MKHRRLLSGLVLAALTLALGGCDVGPNLPRINGNEGAMRFSYSGAEDGRVDARGDVQGGTGTWAFAQTGGTDIVLQSTQTAADGSSIFTSIIFPLPASPRTIRFEAAECAAGGPCASGLVSFSTARVGRNYQMQTYDLTSATIRVSAVNTGRIRGTFTGSLTGPGGIVQITDGEFDLPIYPGG